ncbi:sigma-70 family RNA polymerase sigma factor [Thalassotalea piscium]|uniref:RNA polymerase sigma factor (Sigma-70 family) n=1 Tax=Thalassotalea piscium TaxID=1230533 RepID=A0A7X0TTB9_9GAMM|nr:RNA polymerase sigma factor (sigma-70 family) [Thalassotalea piscium]
MNTNESFTKHASKLKNCIRKDFGNYHVDIDDLIQEGSLGFIDAIEKVDRSKTKNIFNFCYQMAKWRCLDYIRKEKRHHMEVEIDSLDEININELHVFDETNKVCELIFIEKALNACSGHHRQLLLLEIFGIKNNNSSKLLSENSIRRIKREFKNSYLVLTGS